MNILMIVSWYTPMGREKLEAGVFHYEQSMDLIKKGCNVAIYFPFDDKIKEAETCKEEWGILTYRSCYKPGKVLAAQKQIKKTFARIVEEFKPDIIHAHCGGAAGFYSVPVSKKYNIPMIVTEHSPLELTKVDHFGVSYLMTRRAYGHSKMNVCVSKDSMNKLSKVYPKYPFDVIYNGIILPKYKDTHIHYRDGYVNIAIVAILYDKDIKGMQHLIPAMKILKEQGKNVVLHHIGAGEFLDYYENMAKELGVEDIVEFHGSCRRDELYEIVNEMDFFVSASLFECSGVSVQEAMLLGKPVLGTNSGGVDSLVPEKAGHIVQKGSDVALADGIDYMIDHIADYDTDWIKQYAYDSFEIGHISDKYIELYKKVIGGH